MREVVHNGKVGIRAIRYSGGLLSSVISAGSHRSGVTLDSIGRPLQSLGRDCRTKERGDELRSGQCRANLELYSVLATLHGLLKVECKIVLVNISEE